MNITEQLARAESAPDAIFKDLTPAADATEMNQPSPDGAGYLSEQDALNTGSHLSATRDTFAPTGDAFENGASPSDFAPPGTKLGGIVGGKTVTDVADAILPGVMLWAFSHFGYTAKKQELQLTAEEKKTIAPAMQAYLDSINISFDNPLYNLLFVMGGIYAGKVITISATTERKATAQKTSKELRSVVSNSAPVVDAKEALIVKTMKQRKKGRQDAISFLGKQGLL